MKKINLVWVVMLVSGPAVFAHGGHTALESNIWHYISSPDHLLVGFIVLAAGMLLAFRKKLRKAYTRNDKY
jgi:hypothetical protein